MYDKDETPLLDLFRRRPKNLGDFAILPLNCSQFDLRIVCFFDFNFEKNEKDCVKKNNWKR